MFFLPAGIFQSIFTFGSRGTLVFLLLFVNAFNFMAVNTIKNHLLWFTQLHIFTLICALTDCHDML